MTGSRLWIAYDFVTAAEALAMLDTIVERNPDPEIIHEIGRPTLLNAVLEGVPIVSEFRKRLTNGQTLVADFKGFDVPYLAEAKYYYAAGADLVTVMATAPDEAISEAVEGAQADGKLVAFDLMSHQDDAAKADRARQIVADGAKLISCHTGWSEQATGKSPQALLTLVYTALRETDAQLIAMGGLKPTDVPRLAPYAATGHLFAVVAGSAITRADDPNAVIEAFQHELARLA